MFALYGVLTLYFVFLQQFVWEIYLIQFIIPGQLRTDTFIIGCNLQSVEWSVNHSFQEDHLRLQK